AGVAGRSGSGTVGSGQGWSGGRWSGGVVGAGVVGSGVVGRGGRRGGSYGRNVRLDQWLCKTSGRRANHREHEMLAASKRKKDQRAITNSTLKVPSFLGSVMNGKQV
ncbi:hypothetical protein KFL_011590010, partial [Klebsormidium nitens]